MKFFVEFSSQGYEGLVGVFDPHIFTYRASHSELGAVCGYIPYGVCSTYGDRALAQEYLSLKQMTESTTTIPKMFKEKSLFFPAVCHFRAGAYFTILECAKDIDIRVRVKSSV